MPLIIDLKLTLGQLECDFKQNLNINSFITTFIIEMYSKRNALHSICL